MSPTAASGQDYTFGDWARDQGYEPGDVMPDRVRVGGAGIDSLEGNATLVQIDSDEGGELDTVQTGFFPESLFCSFFSRFFA